MAIGTPTRPRTVLAPRLLDVLVSLPDARWLDRLALSVATSQTVVGDATETAHTLWPEDPEAARQRLRHAPRVVNVVERAAARRQPDGLWPYCRAGS